MRMVADLMGWKTRCGNCCMKLQNVSLQKRWMKRIDVKFSTLFYLLLKAEIQEPGMRWILWSIGGLLALWLAVVPLRPLLRRPVLYGVVVSTMVSVIAVGVDATWGSIGWSLEVAVPLGLLVLFWFGALYRASRRFTVWGLPFAAMALLGIATTVSIADGLVNRLYGEPFIGPAFVLLVVAVPFASVALYLHRAGVRLDLRKVLHL